MLLPQILFSLYTIQLISSKFIILDNFFSHNFHYIYTKQSFWEHFYCTHTKRIYLLFPPFLFSNVMALSMWRHQFIDVLRILNTFMDVQSAIIKHINLNQIEMRKRHVYVCMCVRVCVKWWETFTKLIVHFTWKFEVIVWVRVTFFLYMNAIHNLEIYNCSIRMTSNIEKFPHTFCLGCAV